MVAGRSYGAGSPDENAYPGIYRRVIRQSDPGAGDSAAGESENDEESGRLADLIDLYRDIRRADVAQRMRAVYAESLYSATR